MSKTPNAPACHLSRRRLDTESESAILDLAICLGYIPMHIVSLLTVLAETTIAPFTPEDIGAPSTPEDSFI